MGKSFTDMIGNRVELPIFPPKRIVSLVPSQTELLYDLGLDDEVIGITKFCLHPEKWWKSKKRIGGTKTLHLDTIKSLYPDLIIANKEENTKEQIEQLAADFPVWTSNINTLNDAVMMIEELGKICDKHLIAQSLINSIKKQFLSLNIEYYQPKSVVYLIWKSPWMTVGGDTFINDMLQKAGFKNVFEHLERYPEISIETIQQINPQLIFLSSEPYPFKETHIAELQVHLPNAKILLVDGEMFSWYGSRLQYAADYFEKIHQH